MTNKPTYEELEERVRKLESMLALDGNSDARHQGAEALKNANQRLNQIIAFLPDATFVIDARGCVVAWNRAM